MTGHRALWAVIVGALLSMIGIVAMLLSDGTWEEGFLFLAAAPLLLGAGIRMRRLRSSFSDQDRV